MTDPTPPAATAEPANATAAGLRLEDVTRSLNAWVEVDLDALAGNVRALRETVGPGVELIAVVKANAYGAGVEGVAPALEAAGVERFAVVWAAEALNLRRLGITRPIIVLGHAFPTDAEAAVANGITLTVHSPKLAMAVSKAARKAGTRARVHIQVDSGLHRDGVTPDQAVALAHLISGLPGVELEGLSTHMANADEEDDSFADEQGRVFRAALEQLDWVPYRHAANSATAIRRGELRFGGVRIGLAMHGVLPPNTADPGLAPVLSVKARLARVVDVAPGEGVSYGLTWRAERPSRAGLVPIGYADGWSRHLSNRGEVLVGGRRCPMIGRVCMDQFLVDVTELPGAAEGDEAVLLGAQGSERITADDVAARSGTISWDVLASLQARLPRIFHRGGIVQ
ncbi:MAG: alanine racemase [Dehalococcoidia bacterium]|nr:alanine racemase [Dehalococcoidia bacterium]